MARQRLATRVPMRPKPTISRVLLMRSIGSVLKRSPQRFAFTMALSSAPRLASANMKCMACSADRGRIGGAGDHQRHLVAGERRHVHGVVTDADARDHLQALGVLRLGLAEAG